MSTAPRPVGFTPPRHPFVDAQALDGAFEAQLAALLDRCTSAKQFAKALADEGFEVICE